MEDVIKNRIYKRLILEKGYSGERLEDITQTPIHILYKIEALNLYIKYELDGGKITITRL